MRVDIYILGCERSGSTLAANILDSSSKTEVYIEPYNIQMCKAKEFEDRTNLIHPSSFQNLNVLYNEYNSNLYFKKYPFFYYPSRHILLKKLDYFIFQLIGRLNRLKLNIYSRKINDYFELNFSQLFSGQTPTKKKLPILSTVIKEFRLNFKLEFLKYNNPKAKFLILVRDPIFQTYSIINLIKKGSLIELKENINKNKFLLNLSLTSNLEDFYSRIDQRNLIDRIFFYLISNYKYLITNSKNLSLDYRIINYKQLVNAENQYFIDLFNWLNIEFENSIQNYIGNSRTLKNSISPDSPYYKYSQLKKTKLPRQSLINEIKERSLKLGIKEYYSKNLNIELEHQNEY